MVRTYGVSVLLQTYFVDIGHATVSRGMRGGSAYTGAYMLKNEGV